MAGHRLEDSLEASIDDSIDTPVREAKIAGKKDGPGRAAYRGLCQGRRRRLGEVDRLRLRFMLFGALLVLTAYFVSGLPGVRTWWILPASPALLVTAAILAARSAPGERTWRLAQGAMVILLTLAFTMDIFGWPARF